MPHTNNTISATKDAILKAPSNCGNLCHHTKSFVKSGLDFTGKGLLLIFVGTFFLPKTPFFPYTCKYLSALVQKCPKIPVKDFFTDFFSDIGDSNGDLDLFSPPLQLGGTTLFPLNDSTSTDDTFF